MRRPWALLSLGFALTMLGIISPVQSNEEQKDLIQPLIDWLKSNGGIFNDKMEITQTADGYNGVFAKDDILKDELLLEIPRSLLITAGDETDTGNYSIWCPTLNRLVEAWKEGDSSPYAPYAKYLLSQNPAELPSAWSVEGRTLLLNLLGHMDDDSTNDLPPVESVNWIDPRFYEECDDSRDPSGIRAALYLLQRGWDDIMIPFYDMMSHRNGEYLNTMTRDSVHDRSTPIRVYASKDIKAGHEIYSSYNFCGDCGNRDYGYGTPEILRDYGFVEMFPQRWFFYYGVAFQLDQNEETGEIDLEWLGEDQTTDNGIWYISRQLHRMDAFDLESDEAKAVPEPELNMIKQYRDALIVAFETALNYLCLEDVTGQDDEFCILTRSYLSCRAESEGNATSCPLLKRYNALQEEEDDLYYATYTCDTDVSMSFENFDTIETLDSHYQHITYYRDDNDNVCFTIGTIIQICDSYRPQYHEMAVHYTARYLKDVRRMLWVGGGDSMLLHEFLKYQKYDFVVGLELDQTITRYSFKHMGTQPHWDNDKVQWWYGDAAKSMLLLPKEYFGSFDLVVVDLSETVMSMSVTNDLDILQALTLLLKPEGIFVKNELYMDKMASMFRYSLQIHYNWVPVICSQCMVLGSNAVDFLHDEIREHKLDNNLYIKPLETIKENYEFIHDYRHNRTADILCKKSDEAEIEPESQTRSPGVLMVVEVENAGGKLKDAKAVLNTIEKALKKEGLHPVLRLQSETSENPIVTVIMKEGYVVARTWPDKKYVAFDIHFWSSIDKQDAAKNSLVKAVKGRGGRSTSAYRIVAGGMFGVSTWKEDEKKRGPQPTLPCVVDPLPPSEKVMDKSYGNTLVEEAVEEMLKLFDQGGVVAAVLCGEHGTECKAVDVLEKANGVAKVIPVRPCSNMKDINEFEQGGAEQMVNCETEMGKTLSHVIPDDNSKINVFMIDLAADYTAGRIVYEILRTNHHLMMDDNFLAMSVMIDQSEEQWRRNLIERIRTDIIVQDPVFRAEILFNNSESTIEFGATSTKHSDVENNFVRRLVNLASSVESKTGLESDVRFVKGGQYSEDPDWEWEHFYLPEEFDQSGPLEQWLSQQPLAYQVLAQLEKTDEALEISMDHIQSALKYALNRTSSSIEDTWSRGMGEAEMHLSTGMGEGGVIVAFWEGGNCIVLWDGRSHVDLNWFSFHESSEVESEFRKNFISNFPRQALNLALLDEQPRGTGRVVNFLSDLEPFQAEDGKKREYPSWAKKWAAQNKK